LSFSLFHRRPPFSEAAFCRSMKRSRPAGESRQASEPALLQRADTVVASLPVRARFCEPALLSFSKRQIWARRIYVQQQRVSELQVFLPLFSVLLPFQKIIHGSSSLSRARFLRYILFVDGVVDLTRLRFVHAKNVYQILNIRRVQAFQVRET
jgi:hypothetical protein